MTKTERERISALLRAAEFLFLENLALKLVMEHRSVAAWEKLVDHVLADKELLAGVRLKFRGIYREIEHAKDPTNALAEFLGELPGPKKTQ